MRKTYKCSNIKFCMEDENQRRTWEYLQNMTRKDGSYGKVLSDAFVAVLDGVNLTESEEIADVPIKEPDTQTERERVILNELLDEKLSALQETLMTEMESCLRGYALSLESGAEEAKRTDSGKSEQMQEPDISEDMMAFAFAMGG